ncbi:unnamed protein product [Peniophora sp. CBMAI 1063]|nr:unnamed protein product [Peniophora sp. CBMAI 1063]
MASPTFKLNTGATIPAIGYGTWQIPIDQVDKIVAYAILEAGYRHIDCAWMYGNEEGVGKGIKAALDSGKVKREELFITSKVWGSWHSRVEEALDDSLKKLGLEYVDLYLMHWPIPLNPKGTPQPIPLRPDGSRDIDESWDIKDTWKQLEAVVEKGKTKAIGVSNMSQKKLESFLPSVKIVPATNQLEIHAYNPDHALVSYCLSKGILPQAYSPLGSSGSPVMKDETVVKIGEKYGATGADVLLAWLVAKGICAITRSSSEARVKANIEGPTQLAPKLSKEDIATLDGLAAAGKQKRLVTPPWGVDLGFENWPQPAKK